MSAEDLLGALDLPEWLFAPLLLVGCAYGLALTGLPTGDPLLDSCVWLGAEIVVIALARALGWPRTSLGVAFDRGAMVFTAVIGTAVGGHRAATYAVDTIALVGLILGPLCACALVLGALFGRRRRRR